MFNLMLDRLPDNYQGYLIRTDFRTGIKIAQATEDQELDDQERSIIMLTLLYGAGIPQDANIAFEGLKWFLRAGAEEKTEEPEDNRKAFDFDFDHARIWSGFRRVYGIDLSTAQMHWFQFLSLLSDLDGSAFSDVIGYRLADTSKMTKDMQQAYKKMQETYAIPDPLSPEDQERIDEFMSLLGREK